MTGWNSSSKSQYDNIVGNEFRCVYLESGKSSELTKWNINQVTVLASSSGISINYTYTDNGTKTERFNLITFNGGTDSYSLSTKEHNLSTESISKVSYARFDAESFLNHFITNSGCPKRLSLEVYNYSYKGYEIYVHSGSASSSNGDSHIRPFPLSPQKSSQSKSTNNNSESNTKRDGVGNTCLYEDSLVCRGYNKTLEYDNSNTYVELGFTKSTKHMYFYVKNGSQDGSIVASSLSPTQDSSGLKVGAFTYYIRTQDWNLLYKNDEDGFGFASSIVLQEKAIDGGKFIINIAAVGSPTISDYSGWGSPTEYVYPDGVDKWKNNQTQKPEFQKPTTSNTDYDNICSSDEGVKRALNIISTVISIVKWVAPLLIIVLGMVDFARASLSDDEQAINKATTSLIRRVISGIIIFLIPTILIVLLEFMEQISNNDKTYVCIKCALNIDKCSK